MAHPPCLHCGGRIGPAIHGGLMCYGCGPREMMPKEAHVGPAEKCRPVSTDPLGNFPQGCVCGLPVKKRWVSP